MKKTPLLFPFPKHKAHPDQAGFRRRFLAFAFTGCVIKGKGRGKDLGIPTINLKQIKGRIPPNGIYALRCSLEGEEYFGVGSVGLNPTFADKGFSIEIHLFDFDRDIFNEKLDVDFRKKLRDEVAYDTAEDLVDQIHRDIQEARTYFGLGAQE